MKQRGHEGKRLLVNVFQPQDKAAMGIGEGKGNLGAPQPWDGAWQLWSPLLLAWVASGHFRFLVSGFWFAFILLLYSLHFFCFVVAGLGQSW